ncbi:hypothetical protein CHS0354_009187 [Potamilus streckersoni]|uniref:RNase H type-1 domain-containing protein n=1 Tax=Potamilus streckersoni TaxID=2493646 RepID=A0AAE0RYL9_9BIVA|nr:hypothetical protein CHS0354_009187 [Potamilus streckersoni]
MVRTYTTPRSKQTDPLKRKTTGQLRETTGQHLLLYSRILGNPTFAKLDTSHKRKQCLVRTDSISVAKSLKSNSRPNMLEESLAIIRQLAYDMTTFDFLWVPSHIHLKGNDAADLAAKEALQIE